MTKVKRRVICDGEVYEVACALRADGVTSPVASFLDALRHQNWHPDADAQSQLSPDEQIKSHYVMLATVRHFANTGEFTHWTERRPLQDGIWEVKHLELRISFYDTDGRGGYQPKYVTKSPMGGGGYYPIPNFDEYIRLGTVFEKNTQKTPQSELDSAELIRTEDLAHDTSQ
ncbi:MAG: hypothetical protein FWD80_05475 [Propionibacteriaceae bacterium]|nr:hypothetical protein [Propionibacteriaceae bacterium]